MKLSNIFKKVNLLPSDESVLGFRDISLFSDFFKLHLSTDLKKYQDTNFCKYQVFDSTYNKGFGNFSTHNVDMYTLDSQLMCITVTYPCEDVYQIYWASKSKCLLTYEYLKLFEIYFINEDKLDFLKMDWNIDVNVPLKPLFDRDKIIETLEDNDSYFEDDWLFLVKERKLSESFIEKYQAELDWEWVSIKQKLSESFIEKHKDKVDWTAISSYQKLSESFIEKHIDDVNWIAISQHQTLSEEFIAEYDYMVDWAYISEYQKLSRDFLFSFEKKLCPDELSINRLVKKEDYDDFLLYKKIDD